VPLKTADEYRESLKSMRPNVHKFGELIEDVTSHPATRRSVNAHAQIYEQQNDPAQADVFTLESHLTGERISRYLSLIRTPEHMYANSKMKRRMFRLTGSCTGGRCVGWTAINSMWAVTHDIDAESGTDYHQRLEAWLKDAQARDVALCGALTDPKGDRTLAPHQQADPDLNLRIVECRDDGVVVRGAKIMIAGAAAANEVFVLPGTRYGEKDRDYALACVVPRDIDGLTVVEARHPSDMRDFEDGYDNPVEIGGITQGYLLFEDVFVPKERVFMAGEYEHTLDAVMNFIAPYRSAIGGCVAGQGDLMAGAAGLIARANGIHEKVFSDKLVQMHVNNETTYAVGIAAAALGRAHPSGVWQCDQLLANVNKVHVATLPYETKRLTQEIGGGIAETGCMPSCADLDDPGYGGLLKKYLTAKAGPEARVRAARLIEWLTLGSGVPGCMHGGGSPDGAKLVIRARSELKEYMELARRLAGIEEDVPAPEKRGK